MLNRKKIIVYTSIMGGVDDLNDPEFISDEFYYVCFTNNKKIKSRIWDVRYVDSIFSDHRKMARYIKLNPHLFLEKNAISIWIDGNIVILKNLNSLIKEFCEKEKKISTFRHFARNCIYEEGVYCAYLKKDNAESIYKQLSYCISQGYPTNNGLAETNVLIRDHSDSKVIEFMEMWWDCVNTRCIRDQLSFNFCAYKSNMEVDYIPGNARFNIDLFKCKEHKVKSLKDLISYLKMIYIRLKLNSVN